MKKMLNILIFYAFEHFTNQVSFSTTVSFPGSPQVFLYFGDLLTRKCFAILNEKRIQVTVPLTFHLHMFRGSSAY